jgi:hypothetical protein
MKPTMDPIDAHVGEHNKCRYREQKIGPTIVVNVGVQLGVAAHLFNNDIMICLLEDEQQHVDI